MVLAYGNHSVRVITGAVTGGMSTKRALHFDDQSAMAETLHTMARPGDVILFKGSNGMHMDWILDAFLKDET